MTTKMTIEQYFEQEKLSGPDDPRLFDYMDITPALCRMGCMTEPDGHCPHGHPSLFLAMGVI